MAKEFKLPEIKQEDNRFEDESDKGMVLALADVIKDGKVQAKVQTIRTGQQTRWGVSIFKEWLKKVFPGEQFEYISQETLAKRLQKFYQEVKLTSGTHYSRSAHIAIRAALHRHLTSEQVGKQFSIIQDSSFKIANSSLHAKLKRITEEGTCKVQRYSTIEPEDIKKCYDSGIFGGDTPTSLLRVNWFNISLFFNCRRRESQRSFTKNSFQVKQDENGTDFVVMTEEERMRNLPRGSNGDIIAKQGYPRMLASGTNNCPVQYFKKLLSVLHPFEEALFQKPNKRFCTGHPVWFEKSPLGVNTLGKMMTEISCAANLSRQYTNHCVKTTSPSALINARAGIHVCQTCTHTYTLQVPRHWIEVSPTVYCNRDTLPQEKQLICPVVLAAPVTAQPVQILDSQLTRCATHYVTVVQKFGAGDGLEIEWYNGERSRFHSTWLRLNCSCNMCQQKDSGQKTINLLNLPDQISLSSFHVSGASRSVAVDWKNEEHRSIYTLDWLQEHSYSTSDIEKQSQQRRIKPFQGDVLPTISYEEVMNTDEGLLKWLQQLSEHGISLMTGVPCDDRTLSEVAEKIGPVLDTIYGKEFEVVSTLKPINIAYSNLALPLHMDLAYYQPPPGLQLLHCVRFDPEVVGGESTFLDVFAVAEDFRRKHPEDFNTLVRVPATFQKIHFKRENPVYMKYQRPHIALNHRKEIVGVTWSPPFEGPLMVEEEDVEPYYKAYRKFAMEVEGSPLKLEFRVNRGELITFNNIRMLHGRQAFQLNGGVRHLRGVYINIDEFRKKVDVMSRLVGDGRPSKRVGNNCFL